MRALFAENKTDEALLDWLRTLDEPKLARILELRPDSLARPWPRRLEDLAGRLGSTPSVWLALRRMNTPGFELIGAIHLCAALYGTESVTPPQLAEQLGGTESEVSAALDKLSELALAWLDRAGHVRLVGALHDEQGYAAQGLGPPLREPARRATVDQLKRVCSQLGLPAQGRKQQLVDTLLEYFRQPGNVRDLVDTAPDDARELLLDRAWYGPHVGAHIGYLFFARTPRAVTRDDECLEWAVRHGLVWPGDYSTGQLPLEVGLALRGPGYRLPFTPEPPQLDTAPADPDGVAAECTAAAMRIADRTHGVLTAAATDPIPLLKSGGIGVRAVRNLAKKLGATVAEVRLAVELAAAAGLLFPAEPVEPEPAPARRKGRSRSRRPEPPPAPDGLVPSTEFAAWRAESSAGRLRILLETWWGLEQAPLGDEKAVRAVLGDEPSDAFADIRRRTIELLCDLPPGSGATAGLAERISWHCPLLTAEIVDPLVDAALAEATLLGVAASGAPGELAHALNMGTGNRDDPELVAGTDSVVASARTSALFGSDLTAIVTGTADTELSALLDSVADREAQGSASTWRFSPASVRRAFDDGATADGLLTRLGGIAQGELPQPLVYLINDVARRHGELGVVDVRCVVVGDDPALLTEIAAHRKLAELGLHQLAPTVLAARAAASDTLDALRAAGYSPMPREGDGSISVTREQPAPQSVPMRGSGMMMTFDGEEVRLVNADELPQPAEPDPGEHAKRLLHEPVEGGHPVTRGDLTDRLRQMGVDYHTPKWWNFAWRLELGGAAEVDYHEPDGSVVGLRISRPELHGDALNVWSTHDDDYRTLELARITPA